MSKISPTNTYVFEQWLLVTHEDLFNEWELEASEWLDLDEWLWREYCEVLDEWWKFRKANPTWRPSEPIGGNADED